MDIRAKPESECSHFDNGTFSLYLERVDVYQLQEEVVVHPVISEFVEDKPRLPLVTVEPLSRRNPEPIWARRAL